MPLARIFTRNPERTSALSRELHEQGYTVETVNPDQAQLTPADVEIEFEVCERADVLERANHLAAELDADVAVAPGVLRAMASPAASAPESRDPETEFEAAFAPVIEMPAPHAATLHPVEASALPVTEHAPLPPVAMMEQSIEHSTEHAMETSARAAAPAEITGPVPYLAQLMPFSHHAQTGSPEREQSTKVAARHSQETAETPVAETVSAGASTRSALTDVLAGAGVLASSTASSVRGTFLEYKKRAEVRSAEARAAREARLLDLEQRRTEAQQRAAELSVAREAAAARLMELVRQREPGLMEKDSGERDREAEKVVSVLPPRQPVDRTNSAFRLKRTHRSINPQLRAVITGAGAVSVLFVVGLVLGAFHSKTPLANPSTHAANGVTVQSGGVTVQAGKAPGPATEPPASVTTADKNPELAKPSPRIQPQASGRQSAAEEADAGDKSDVVVRHFKRPIPVASPRQSAQRAGLKHFSDLDN
jgi:hypothetical protein